MCCLGDQDIFVYTAFMVNVVVKKSKIQGKGAFANENFKKGEVVLKIDDSHIITDYSTLTKYQKKYQCDWLENSKCILMQSPERYINHCCDPNTYIKTVRGVRIVWAMRDIKKGDEITYDYAVNGYYDTATKCRCGSKKCRKTLNFNFFELPRNRQIEYLPYLDIWFKREFKKELSKIKKNLVKEKTLVTSSFCF